MSGLDLDALEAAIARFPNAPFHQECQDDTRLVIASAAAPVARARVADELEREWDADEIAAQAERVVDLETWAASVLETVDELTAHEDTRRSNVEELRALLEAP